MQTAMSAQINVGSLALAGRPTVATMTAAAVVATPGAAQIAPTATITPVAVAMPPTIRIDSVRLLDPAFGQALSTIPLVVPGVPRDKITVPISSAAEPGDAVLYQSPDGSTTFYLPRYGLATRLVSGAQQYWASLTASDGRWAFSVRLTRTPDARLGGATRDAQRLPHEVNLLLQYTVPRSGNMQKELIFDEVVEEQDLLHATLYVNTIAERDELFYVLTDPKTPALLIARRNFKIAIPVSAPPPVAAGSSGTATLRGTWFFDFNAGAEGTAGDVWWEQVDSNVRHLVPRGQAQVAVLGQVDFNAVTLEQLKQQPYSQQPIDGSITSARPPVAPANLRVAFNSPGPVVRPPTVAIPIDRIQANAHNQLTPGTVFAVKTNAGSYSKVKVLACGYNLQLQWQTFTEGPTVLLFRETTRTLDDGVPLAFDRDLHRYVFPDITGASGQGAAPGFLRWTVDWAGRSHSYYQETARPEVFHFLPDAFKLARRPQSPHVPLIAFQVETPDDSETPTIRFDYSAFRVQDDKRLLHAAPELMVKASVPAGKTPVFLPINIDGPTFTLALPRGGASGPFQPRPGAAVSSSLGIADSLTGMPLEDFQTIWDAMADDTGNAVLFQGRVEFRLTGEPPEQIPFVGRLGDMAGDVVDVTYAAIANASSPANGGVTATVRNAIESPATIKALSILFARNSASAPGTIVAMRTAPDAAVPALPFTLAAGQSIEIDATPAAVPPGDGPLTPALVVSDLGISPSLPEVLKIIALGRKPQSSRRVTVSTFSEVLTRSNLTQIKVEFEHGQGVTLSAAALEAVGKVSYFVLPTLARDPDADQYRFRVVTPAGAGAWQMATSDSITITSDLLPGPA
jgi:hypothetical protein